MNKFTQKQPLSFICFLLQELAKDSAKYRSKKERKEQKSSFRDILKTIEDDEEFYEKVAFSKRETLEITSWGMKIQYEQLCKVRKKFVKIEKRTKYLKSH